MKTDKRRLGRRVALIRKNDNPVDDIIYLGINRATYEGKPGGYRVAASNGDDIGYYVPQSREHCIRDIDLMYGHWHTFFWIGNGEYLEG